MREIMTVHEMQAGMFQVYAGGQYIYIMARRELQETSKWLRHPQWRHQYSVNASGGECTIDASWYNFQDQFVEQAYRLVREYYQSQDPELPASLSDEEYYELFPEKRPEQPSSEAASF